MSSQCFVFVAYARCCNFPSGDVSCKAIHDTSWTGTSDDALRTVSCATSQYQYLMGCTGWSPWSNLDGVYFNLDQPQQVTLLEGVDYEADGWCSVRNGNNGKKSRGNVVCCDSTLELDCKVRYGDDDTTSTVSCGSGYEMVGCAGYGKWASIKLYDACSLSALWCCIHCDPPL